MGWGKRSRVASQTLLSILKTTLHEFDHAGLMKYCASLSFYTLFSIAPLLIIAISIGSFFFGKDAVNGHLFGQIHDVVGTDAAIAVQEMLRTTTLRKDNLFATAMASIVFFVGATGVFAELQSTLNRIWGLRARPRKGLLRYIVSRLWSFAMVVTFVFLTVVSLVANAVIDALNERLHHVFADTGVIMFGIRHLVTLCIITFLFALIFKFLPDSVIVWRDAFIGALFTAVLFLAGKYLIGLYMGTRAFESAYGAAGSLVVILLWIYYSSVLMYFGAEFTRVYAVNHGHGIRPNAFSVRVRYREEEIADHQTADDGVSP